MRTVESLAERERRLVARLSLVMIIGGLSSLLILLFVTVISGFAFITITVDALCFLSLLSYILAFVSAKRGTNVRLASWFMVLCLNLVISYAALILGWQQPVVGAYFISTMLSLFLLPWQFTVGFLVFAGLSIAVINIGHLQSQITLDASVSTYFATAIWLIVVIVPAGLGIYLLLEYKKTLAQALAQNKSLQLALQNLQSNKETGQEVSKRLYTVTSELQITSSQQASGSQQQAKEISQISDLFAQQVQVAEFIARYAENIAKTSDGVLEATWRVTNASNTTKQQGERGANATKQTTQAIVETRDYFQGLLFALENVQDINAQIADVNSLIQQFTRDLHVLSLNAAIEAAGAGGQQPRMTKLANEIKKLAERGGSSAETIKNSLAQIEIFVSRAVTEIRAGQRITQTAVDTAQQSGHVMQQLIQAIGQNEQEALNIGQLALDLHDITDAIKRSTATAYSTIQDATQNLQNVSVIVQQNASGSYQLASSARDIRQLTEHLEAVLVAS